MYRLESERGIGMKQLRHFWKELKAFISHLNDQIEENNPYDKRSHYRDYK